MEDKKVMEVSEAEKIREQLDNSYGLGFVEELIKDNTISFEYKGDKYRVKLIASIADKEQLDSYRRKKFNEMLADKTILFEKDLIKAYLDRGILINEIIDGLAKMQKEKEALDMKLGEAISKKTGEGVLKTIKNDIEILNKEIQLYSIRKSDLLEFSFENQLLNYVIKISTWLALEINKEEKWKRAYPLLSDFEKCEDNNLINLAGKYTLFLQYV